MAIVFFAKRTRTNAFFTNCSCGLFVCHAVPRRQFFLKVLIFVISQKKDKAARNRKEFKDVHILKFIDLYGFSENFNIKELFIDRTSSWMSFNDKFKQKKFFFIGIGFLNFLLAVYQVNNSTNTNDYCLSKVIKFLKLFNQKRMKYYKIDKDVYIDESLNSFKDRFVFLYIPLKRYW